MSLRVLALHGFGQNAAVFAEKRIKELTRKLKSTAVFHCLDAPHVLPYDPALRGWWSYPEELWDGKGETIQALADRLLQQPDFQPLGLEESFELVLGEWLKGGYDGVLGFSQGAILAAALCAELHRRGPDAGPRPRFAILVSGFGRPTPRGLEAYPPREPLPVPSLHVWGAADDHIPGWASEALAAHFHEPQTYVHPGHHFVPQKAADSKVFQDFLAAFPPSAAPVPAEQPRAEGPRAAQPARGDEPRPVGDAQQPTCAEPPLATAEPRPAAAEPRPAVAAPKPPADDELAGALRRYGAAGGQCGTPATAAAEPAASAATGRYLEEELAPPGPGTYERLLALLAAGGAEAAQLGPHAPCRTSEDAVRVRLEGGWEGTTLRSGAKAMLLRAQDGAWLLAVLPADCKLGWKKLRALRGKGTRMATEDEVREVTGCLPGAVPPLAAAFPLAVECLADAALPAVINFNCGLRSRSIRMSRADFERIQKPLVVDIAE